MEVVGTEEFAQWFVEIRNDRGSSRQAERRALRAVAMLNGLRELDHRPMAATATIRPVAEARRHPLWRVSHSHDGVVQVRFIVWFSGLTKVWVLVAGDKTGNENTWYTMAVINAEIRVDRIKRNMDREETHE